MLDSKGGDKKFYSLSKVRKRRYCDLGQVKCIKNANNEVLVEEVLIKQRLQSNFHKILTEERYVGAFGAL